MPPRFPRRSTRSDSAAAGSEHREDTLGAAERARLEAGLRTIRPLLEQREFEYSAGSQAVSSGGAFATGVFSRGPLQIELIVRNKDALGCPNYTDGQGYVGHEDLVWALGAEGEQQLVEGQWLVYQARDGGDPFTALASDLKHIVLPALDASESEFLASLTRDRQHLREQRGW